MRKILLGGLVVVLAFVAALLAINWLSPSAPATRPPLAEIPPLKPATRTSVVIAPTAIALSAIRDSMEAQTPRDLSGKRDNPVGQLLQMFMLATVLEGRLIGINPYGQPGVEAYKKNMGKILGL